MGVANAEGVIEETVAVPYDAFITNIIDFIIIAFIMFLIVKAANKLKKEEEEKAPAGPAGPSQEDLLAEIRDLLAKK